MKIFSKFFLKVFYCVKVKEKWFYSENIPQRGDIIKNSDHLNARNGSFMIIQVATFSCRLMVFNLASNIQLNLVRSFLLSIHFDLFLSIKLVIIVKLQSHC